MVLIKDLGFCISPDPLGDRGNKCTKIHLTNDKKRLVLYKVKNFSYNFHLLITNLYSQQGFDDTLRFLARNDLIGCDTCMTMEQSLSLGVELDEMATKNYERIMSEESCHQCKAQKQVCGIKCLEIFLDKKLVNKEFKGWLVTFQAALLDSLPETVVSILQDAIESGNRGLLNWLFSHKTMKLLSLMSLPCIIPADIAYATVLKIFETAPKLTYNFRVLSQAVLQLVAQTLSNISLSPAAYSAKLTCQVAITEYNEGINCLFICCYVFAPTVF